MGQQMQNERFENLQAQNRILHERFEEKEAAPPPDLRIRPQIKSPDTFDGAKPAEDDWLFQTRLYFEATMMNTEQRVPLATALLRGKALTWWRYRVREKIPAISFNDFAALARAQFQGIDSVKRARDQLAVLRQMTSVERYANTFRGIIMAIPNIHQDEAFNRFTRGLKPRSRTEVALRDPKSLDKVIQIAVRLDFILSEQHRRPERDQHDWKRSRSWKPQAVPARSHHTAGTSMDLDAIDSGRRRTKLTEEERQRLRALGACFFCRRTGHIRSRFSYRPRRRAEVNVVEASSHALEEADWREVRNTSHFDQYDMT